MSLFSREAIENLSIEFDVIVIKSEIKVKKIDPKKQMKILIGSGFAENIKSPKLFLERENYGNSFETII